MRSREAVKDSRNIAVFTIFSYIAAFLEGKQFFLSGAFSMTLKTIGKYTVFPGFADVHVHLREPGFSYKETIYTGSRAAAHGGYTTLCTMPNLSPFPDTLENLKVQLDIIDKDSAIRIIPYGCITKGESGTELSNMEELAPFVVAFSDDGKGDRKSVV